MDKVEWGNVYGGVPTLEQTLAEIANERAALRAENERLKKTLAIPQGYRLQPISEFDAMESARIEAEARVAELRGLCNWAAGRMLDAGDIAGHEEVLRKLGQGT